MSKLISLISTVLSVVLLATHAGAVMLPSNLAGHMSNHLQQKTPKSHPDYALQFIDNLEIPSLLLGPALAKSFGEDQKFAEALYTVDAFFLSFISQLPDHLAYSFYRTYFYGEGLEYTRVKRLEGQHSMISPYTQVSIIGGQAKIEINSVFRDKVALLKKFIVLHSLYKAYLLSQVQPESLREIYLFIDYIGDAIFVPLAREVFVNIDLKILGTNLDALLHTGQMDEAWLGLVTSIIESSFSKQGVEFDNEVLQKTNLSAQYPKKYEVFTKVKALLNEDRQRFNHSNITRDLVEKMSAPMIEVFEQMREQELVDFATQADKNSDQIGIQILLNWSKEQQVDVYNKVLQSQFRNANFLRQSPESSEDYKKVKGLFTVIDCEASLQP